MDICSKISDEEKAVWINATMALQRDPSINMAVVTTSSEVIYKSRHWGLAIFRSSTTI